MDYQKAWESMKRKVDRAEKYYTEQKEKEPSKESEYKNKSEAIDLVKQYIFDCEQDF